MDVKAGINKLEEYLEIFIKSILPEESLNINKIQFNSKGFWEFLGDLAIIKPLLDFITGLIDTAVKREQRKIENEAEKEKRRIENEAEEEKRRIENEAEEEKRRIENAGY